MTYTRCLPLRWALAAVLALVVVLGAPTLAAAHEGPGIVTVEADQPTPTGHRYMIRLTWQDDGHPAARDTTITATAFGPDGVAQTPVPMTAVDDDGRFEATIELPEPGQWRVNFTSVTPRANLDVTAQVQPATTTTAATTGSSSPSSAGADDTVDDEAASNASDDEGGSSATILVVLAVLVVGALTATAVVWARLAPAAAIAANAGTGDGPTDSAEASTADDSTATDSAGATADDTATESQSTSAES